MKPIITPLEVTEAVDEEIRYVAVELDYTPQQNGSLICLVCGRLKNTTQPSPA